MRLHQRISTFQVGGQDGPHLNAVQAGLLTGGKRSDCHAVKVTARSNVDMTLGE